MLARLRKVSFRHEESELPTSPKNLLEDKSRCCKLEQSRNLGKLAEMLLLERSKCAIFFKLNSEKLPLTLFPIRERCCSSGNAAERSHETTSSPEILLYERSRICRDGRPAACGGAWV